MAGALNVEFDGDPPVYTRTVEDDLVFFSTIDDATQTWLNSLHHIWGLWKKSVGVTQTLVEYFETAPNPYLSTLRILVNVRDFYHIRSRVSLSFTVIEEFSKWIAPIKDKYVDCLVSDLKIAAFRLLNKQKNMQLIKLVSDVYEFSADTRYFIPLIKEFIQDKKFKEAGQFVEFMKLQSEFSDPELLLLPLILQNKVNIVEDILRGQPEMQHKFIKYLDDLLDANTNMQQILDRYIIDNDIPDVKMSTLQHKPISKLVARFVKLYGLPPDTCPNLDKQRGKGALRFLLYKRYVDGSLSAESWREMAHEALAIDPRLHVEILTSLVNVNDLPEALYFAQTYNVSKDQWPWHLTQYADQNLGSMSSSQANNSNNDEVWDADDDRIYHTLSLPRERIKIINDQKSFEDFLDHGLKNIYLVGIDSEWKPSFSIRKPELALIQIATLENVYIFDVTTLGKYFEHLWTELGLTLFNNKNILKLGFGIAHDISMIRENLPTLSHIRSSSEGYLDLGDLWKKLLKEDNFAFPYKGDESFTNENLSKLVELCFGQRLKKSDQFSNWELRPLRESQIVYAALDAYCLVEIYEVLTTQCDRFGIPFHDLCHHINHKSHVSSASQQSYRFSKSNAKRSNNKNNYSGVQFQEAALPSPKVCFPLLQNQESQSTSIGHQNFKSTSERHAVRNRSSKVQEQPLQTGYFGVVQQQSAESFTAGLTRDNDNQSWLPISDAVVNTRPVSEKTVAISNNAFVCDSMLGDLARQLRKCGIDCVHFEYDPDSDWAINVAFAEKRVFLTSHGNFERFKLCLPHKYCYQVKKYKPKDQLIEVLNQFGIEVSEVDIFSRCQLCNSNEFVHASKDTMMQLFQRFGKNFHSSPSSSAIYSTDLQNQWDSVDRASQMRSNDLPSQEQFTSNMWPPFVNTLNMTNCTTKYNAKVQLDQVPLNTLQYVKEYHICNGCGKVYWHGSYRERILNGNFFRTIKKNES